MTAGHRVAMVAACPYPSGQGTQALIGELARGMAARGHRVHLICYAHGGPLRREPFAIHRAWPLPGYRRLRAGPDPIKPLLDLGVAWRAGEVVRRCGCALIHAHNYEGALAGWLAARSTGVPLLYHAHNLMEDELPRYFRGPGTRAAACRLGWALDRSVPRLADRVLALHTPMAEALQRCGVRADRLRVVAPGIDTDAWTPADGAGERAGVGLRVAYCGNLDAYQELELLFAAMRRVVAALPGAELLLATPNPLAEARAMARRCGAGAFTRVVVAADPTATRRALAGCALAVCARSSPSGFPLKNLNAAAAGLPLVVCRGAAHGLDPGRSGLVVPDGDARSLADAVVGLLRQPRRRFKLGEAGRELIRARYTRDRMCREVEEEWDALV
jgi:glycosyltransferase involved in cell wall biosynthesis